MVALSETRGATLIVNQSNKNAARGGIVCGARLQRLLATCARLGANLAKLLTELVDATGRINDFVFARIERMRLGRNFNFEQRILLPIELDSFARLNGRAGQEFEVAREVVHDNFAVLGVDAFFHYSLA